MLHLNSLGRRNELFVNQHFRPLKFHFLSEIFLARGRSIKISTICLKIRTLKFLKTLKIIQSALHRNTYCSRTPLLHYSVKEFDVHIILLGNCSSCNFLVYIKSILYFVLFQFKFFTLHQRTSRYNMGGIYFAIVSQV